MKKTIQKPENWQDFESLCKKLWGEIWSIPMKIKKNGRNGQPQAGVDIYGVPKGETSYWGIQCKGKDEYISARLTTKEIDLEIEKARTFKPQLDVFIFSTTMNKDSSIEEYIRLKDLKSRQIGGFEILLFCWEDIADLIDENRDTYNFYVANNQHKTKFDFELYLNDFKTEFTIRPKCIRKIRKYSLKGNESEEQILGLPVSLINPSWKILMPTLNKINESICKFEIIMKNTGGTVIEDWKVRLRVSGEYKEIMDLLGTGPMGMIDLAALKSKRTYITDNTISYTPNDNNPLIQKDNRYFNAYIIPLCKEYTIPIEWELLARDFDKTGVIYLKVEPDYEDQYIYEYVESIEKMEEDEIISVKEKKNY